EAITTGKQFGRQVVRMGVGVGQRSRRKDMASPYLVILIVIFSWPFPRSSFNFIIIVIIITYQQKRPTTENYIGGLTFSIIFLIVLLTNVIIIFIVYFI
ncbi:hypothetical protein JZ751_025109, partial [Albula glossodonta]